MTTSVELQMWRVSDTSFKKALTCKKYLISFSFYSSNITYKSNITGFSGLKKEKFTGPQSNVLFISYRYLGFFKIMHIQIF